MNEVAKKLREAMALWEAHPTKGSYARDAFGDPVSYSSVKAVCWCSSGALLRVCDVATFNEAYDFLADASQELTGYGVARVNDDHADLMPDVWSEAIEAAEALETR